MKYKPTRENNFIWLLIALVSLIVRGIDIDCGCFRPDAEVKTSPLAALLRDMGLMVLVLMTWFLERRKNREERI